MELLFYVLHPYKFHTLWTFYVYNVDYTRPMIAKDTPYKLAEIIRDTWPGLYRKPQVTYNSQKTNNNGSTSKNSSN